MYLPHAIVRFDNSAGRVRRDSISLLSDRVSTGLPATTSVVLDPGRQHPRAAWPSPWSSYRVSYTGSKTLDKVGEFFFSSPISNLNIWQDYGRSDNDQRHRMVVGGLVHNSLKKTTTTRAPGSEASTETRSAIREVMNCSQELLERENWTLGPSVIGRLIPTTSSQEHAPLESSHQTPKRRALRRPATR